MGLTFKPSKCRSLSIYQEKKISVLFFLKDPNTDVNVQLKTLEDDPHKFLGALVTYKNTPQEHFVFLKEKLVKKLENLDVTSVRGEFKVAVYSRYILPALRYHLTVHTVHRCHLDQLDMCTLHST